MGVLDKDWNTILNRFKTRNFSPFLAKIYKKYWEFKDHDGVGIVDEDWDYLIVLDACRYDVFEEVNWIEGDLTKVVSRGSCTPEWLKNNFTEYYGDIVYIASNPFVVDLDLLPDGKDVGDLVPFDVQGGVYEGDFYEIEPVYFDEDAIELGTVKPEKVTEYAIKAKKRHPDKRLIIHYMQPHDPYIGDPSIAISRGDVDRKNEYFRREDSWEAYKSNLKRALESVEKLIEELEGKIVVTADHGDCFGEYGLYRHPAGVYFKELVEVPWLVIEKGDRPATISENKDIGDIDV